jgi:hypothetical protein
VEIGRNESKINMRVKEFLELIKDNGFKIIPKKDGEQDKVDQLLNNLHEFCEISDTRTSQTFFYRDDKEKMCISIGSYVHIEAPIFGKCDSGFCKGNILKAYQMPDSGPRLCQSCVTRILLHMWIGL